MESMLGKDNCSRFEVAASGFDIWSVYSHSSKCDHCQSQEI